jgi:hypothetical protein
VLDRSRIVLLAATALTLCGCTDGRVVAKNEVASVQSLVQPGASADSIKLLLTRRGYQCAEGSGQFVFTCVRNVGGRGLACEDDVVVSLVTRETTTDLQVSSEERCL